MIQLLNGLLCKMPLSLYFISLSCLSLGGNQNSRIFDLIMQSMPMPSVNRQGKFASLLNIHCDFFYFCFFFLLTVGILQAIFNVRDEI